MTATTYRPTERDLAKARWDEATAVKDAWDSVVTRRRGIWRNAPDGKAADKARRNLADAVAQYKAALDQERAAWRAWHGLGPSRK